MSRRPAYIAAAVLALLVFRPVVAQEKPPEDVYVRANYTKYEFEIPMRDGVKLFTAVYVPKDRSTSYPIMLLRTPYSVAPYGVDQYRPTIGPSDHFMKDGFIVVYQDVRGRYMSEGEWTEVRPHNPKKGPKETDEASDTWDTIDWLVKNVPGNNGKVGMWGISYPGFYVSAGMIDAHPALIAASPQAPVTDYYLGDDSFHNGAFLLAHNFGFYTSFKPRQGGPSPPVQGPRFDWGTPDGYDFYLRMGPLSNSNAKYLKDTNPYWDINLVHPNYDAFWQARSIWKHFKNIKPAVLTVGGWFDAEDLQGPLRTYQTIERDNPGASNAIVMGPWTHGGWSRGAGDKVGFVSFGANQSEWYREHVEFPFFVKHLKGGAPDALPDALMFLTGLNEWRRHDTWPPKTAQPKTLYFGERGALVWQKPTSADGADSYVADPNRPVPLVGYTAQGMPGDYMTSDQRFASQRPDVLVYETPPLGSDLTIAGPIEVTLHVSTTGTDADFVVKLIDVYPGSASSPDAPAAGTAYPVKMGGYQQLVRGEPFRGKFRSSFEKPEPFAPGQPATITFTMPDAYHTFRRGHRVMVHVQSSWFPFIDRNPQTFVDIPKATEADFVVQTHKVFRSASRASGLTVRVEP
jgi:putative CocE/NonD family hydrolase